MTDEEAAAIAARAENAAPGPWTLRKGDLYTIEGTDPPHYRVMSRFLATDEDTAFILHARTDIPALLAERAALREIVRVVAALSEPRTDARRTWECSFCGAYLIAHDHESDCLVLKARALLTGD